MRSLLDQETVDEIKLRLDKYNNWLLLTHEAADGDTLGCALALYSLAQRHGKNARIIGKSGMPDKYVFLPFAENYEQQETLTAEDVTDETLVICVDTSTLERSVGGLDGLINANNSINIDHHGDNHLYAGLNVVAANASATAEIIVEIMRCYGCELNKNEATCLYTALVTDNGNFKFKSTTPYSHLCAAWLLEAGFDHAELEDRITQNMTIKIMRLWGEVLQRVEIFADGVAAISWLSDADFIRADADAAATDGLVNMLLRLKNVDIAILLSSVDNVPKLSVRTRLPYSAREIASEMGGGGHIQAAGAKMDTTMEEALEVVRDTVIEYVADRTITAQ